MTDHLSVSEDHNRPVIMDTFTSERKENVLKFVEMEKVLDNFSVMMVTEMMVMAARKPAKFSKVSTALSLTQLLYACMLEQLISSQQSATKILTVISSSSSVNFLPSKNSSTTSSGKKA